MAQFQARKMFETGIFCVILLAIGYWVALWLIGRHDDVLHGDFIHAEHGPDPLPSPSSRADSSDTLESLLVSIKRDLKDAAQL